MYLNLQTNGKMELLWKSSKGEVVEPSLSFVYSKRWSKHAIKAFVVLITNSHHGQVTTEHTNAQNWAYWCHINFKIEKTYTNVLFGPYKKQERCLLHFLHRLWMPRLGVLQSKFVSQVEDDDYDCKRAMS